ncbi:sugar ABC transporter permease [Paenibacillus sp. J5C_2022]|uniref:carbohydrate ABC transporter permease n=1 Tax=Paenibacillus sp. J5C2022 TaxID=2977129 RepID=UPI0021D3E491|nr:sugar ABC transporter permease [Paenibacillus sp. J5C2022]MCU6710547.1 sugar ABC transporter permease [Paenibacillus sp. J5C2022]
MFKIYRNFTAYFVFVVPALLLYAIFYVTPLFQSLGYSVTSWNGINEPVYTGLDNFVKGMNDEKFWISLRNNLYFVGFSVFIQMPLIILVAIMVSSVKRMLNFYKLTVFLPSILSTAAVAVIWRFIYAPEAGLLNSLLEAVGLGDWTQVWLGNKDLAIWAIIAANGWQWTGFYIVLLLAAIFALPKEMIEAGEIDGAVGWRKAWFLTIPLIRPVIGVSLLLSVTGAMKALDIVLIMTKGGPFGSTELMATYMYKQAYSISDFGYANAISIIIAVFTALLSVFVFLFNRSAKEVS